jgi:hypothetical protein
MVSVKHKKTKNAILKYHKGKIKIVIAVKSRYTVGDKMNHHRR